MLEVPPAQQNWRVLRRFVGDLTLLKKLLPVILSLIILASSTPQFFLWYVGELVKCPGPVCMTAWLGRTVPVTVARLMVIAVAGIALRIIAWMAFEATGMWSSSPLHDRMIAALARVRTTYFDDTPSGHLLNRITGDFSNLRFMGVIRLGDATNALIEVLATMVLVLLVNPWPALLMAPVTIIFIKVQLDIGPMLGHSEEIASKYLGEVLHRETDMIEGRRIYALYGKQPALLRSLHAGYVRLTDARLLSARLQAWSRLWTRGVSAVYGFVVLLFLTLSLQQGRISLTLAAVVVSALFSLSGSFGWMSWCLAYLTETLGNARRVYEIVDLPHERDGEFAAATRAPCQELGVAEALARGARGQEAGKGDVASAARGPGQGPGAACAVGDLVFHHLTISYRADTPVILHDLCLHIRAGQKVGLIGRTGAGKSSVMQALFRMVHVHAGDITIGGQSIYCQSAERVRSLFGVVPQNPYLFHGTIRRNLDRYGQWEDRHLAAVMAAVELPLPLDASVAEGGRNFSLGERQLLCLARILLANKPFVIMDEPTSAVDPTTDAKIQRLLLRELAGRTLITIAHRLASLRSYDQIIELSAGRVVRQGAPAVFFEHAGS